MSGNQILVADDDEAIRTVLSRALTQAGYEVLLASNLKTLWKLVNEDKGDLIISDVMMPDGTVFEYMSRIANSRPDLSIIIMSAQNTLMTAIKATEEGAFDYLPKPFDLNVLLQTVNRALQSQKTKRLAQESEPIAGDMHLEEDMPLVGRSAAMQDVYRVLARMTQNDLTVLISGESGTGKELVARALHDFGKRKKRPFVAINMAAIPKDLIESELFGHEKGAFTGAQAKTKGQFEHAQGGTLFLDEIGDMPLEAQTRLLRVLQQGEYTSVGGRIPIKTDVRIVAATNKNLQELIQEGKFRDDLYFRLNVVPLRLPPLRERKQDIASLASYFARKQHQSGRKPRIFDNNAIEMMNNYAWPGNVRELENFVSRICVLYQQEVFTGDIIEQELANSAFHSQSENAQISDISDLESACKSFFSNLFNANTPEEIGNNIHHKYLEKFERPLIVAALKANEGNQVKTAETLGLNRNTLRKKIADLSIEKSKY